MSKTIAMTNHKGGVGKTTSVALLGEALAELGKNVLLVDLDAQANLTGFFMNENDVEISIYDAMLRQQLLPVVKVSDKIHLVPSSIELARAEIDLSTRLQREQILAKLLQPYKNSYDYILLDCSPSLGIVTTNALVAADEVYIPLTAEALPMKGLTMLEEVVDEIKNSVNEKLKIGGVIITRYNNRNLNKVVLNCIEEKFGDVKFKTCIRENINVAETPMYGGNIFKFQPNSYGAKDYLKLAHEVIAR